MDERELIERIGGLEDASGATPLRDVVMVECGHVVSPNSYFRSHSCRVVRYADLVGSTEKSLWAADGKGVIGREDEALTWDEYIKRCRCHGTGWVPKSRAEAIVALQDWCVERGLSPSPSLTNGIVVGDYGQDAYECLISQRVSDETVAYAHGATWQQAFLEAFYAACLAEGYRDPKTQEAAS